jgi:hypothetical protein
MFKGYGYKYILLFIATIANCNYFVHQMFAINERRLHVNHVALYKNRIESVERVQIALGVIKLMFFR